MLKEVKKEQLNKTIDEINYLNEIQSSVLSRPDFTSREMEQLEFMRKYKSAKRTNAIKQCFKSWLTKKHVYNFQEMIYYYYRNVCLLARLCVKRKLKKV